MELYYLDKNEFLTTADTSCLNRFKAEKQDCSESRQTEYALGRFLVTYVFEKRFNLKKPEILLQNKKPYVKDCGVYFSISHSENIIATVFDKSPVGFDLEKIKERDFSKLSKRYGLKNAEKLTFYRFWTEYEAKIKLQQDVVSAYSKEFLDEYYMCIVSSRDISIEHELKINKINLF